MLCVCVFGRTHRSAPTALCLRSLKSLRTLGSLRSLWPKLCIFRAFCRGRPVCLPFIVRGFLWADTSVRPYGDERRSRGGG